MKLQKVIFLMVVLLFSWSLLNAGVVDNVWNTFLGGNGDDYCLAFTTDSSGNTYVTGYCYSTWGSPIDAYSGNSDTFVACVDRSGNLCWNTFLGSSEADCGYGIARDSSGNIYVTGYSDATWGLPINTLSGNSDAFVACLDSSGNLVWNTFLGSTQSDFGYGIVQDSTGNIFVTGVSWATWGSPVNSFSGNSDAFVACLDSSGNLFGNTFFGSDSSDESFAIALDSAGHINVVGYSWDTWGSPIRAHSGNWDVYIVSLNKTGKILWNTFLGSEDHDFGTAITMDNSNNIYVTGYSYASWGSPTRSFNGYSDGFVAVLDSSGNLRWNSFVGSDCLDAGYGITLDNSGNIYITGCSMACWGTPENPHCGDFDVYVASLNSSGDVLWNTFLGSNGSEFGLDISINDSREILLLGYSNTSWGSSVVRNYTANWDSFAMKLSSHPDSDITANGSDGPISITQSDILQIKVSLNAIGLTDQIDLWLWCKTPSGYIHYNQASNSWEAGTGVTYQGTLHDIDNEKVYQKSGLAPGTYRFFFGVDMKMDGKLTKDCLYYDEVKVTITEN